jgi:hypothetical protein
MLSKKIDNILKPAAGLPQENLISRGSRNRVSSTTGISCQFVVNVAYKI